MAYDASQRPGETALAYYKRLAKVADQRIVRLEKLVQKKGYENVLKYAYKGAQKDISHWKDTPKAKIPVNKQQLNRMTKAGKVAGRFNTAPPTNKKGEIDLNKLMAKISDIKSFLEKPTSTQGQIKTIYQKRVAKINKKYGTDFSWEDIGDFFESDAYKDLASTYGSDTILKMRNIVVENRNLVEELSKYDDEEDIVDALKQNASTHLHLDDNVVNKQIASLLADKNLSLLKLHS